MAVFGREALLVETLRSGNGVVDLGNLCKEANPETTSPQELRTEGIVLFRLLFYCPFPNCSKGANQCEAGANQVVSFIRVGLCL